MPRAGHDARLDRAFVQRPEPMRALRGVGDSLVAALDDPKTMAPELDHNRQPLTK
jgi:hypothetical protein